MDVVALVDVEALAGGHVAPAGEEEVVYLRVRLPHHDNMDDGNNGDGSKDDDNNGDDSNVCDTVQRHLY